MPGTCTKCGRPAHYLGCFGAMHGRWVHTETLDSVSSEPTLHDVNTYVEIPARVAS